MRSAKAGRRLLTGTSYGGGTVPGENVVRAADFLLLHGNGVKSFGMWVPNTDPSGSGLIAQTRYRGQEGAQGQGQGISAHVDTLIGSGPLRKGARVH